MFLHDLHVNVDRLLGVFELNNVVRLPVDADNSNNLRRFVDAVDGRVLKSLPLFSLGNVVDNDIKELAHRTLRK